MSCQKVYLQMAQLLRVDREQLVTDVRRRIPDLETSSPHAISVVPVRTFIGNGETLSSGTFPGFVAPAFASHWGIVVDDTLYHLIFRNQEHANLALNDLSRQGKPIRFACSYLEQDKINQCQVVGETYYDHRGLTKIGKALIEAFGSYHRLFWNCQVFADCFLYLITNGRSFVE
jgi:hypothetical protein